MTNVGLPTKGTTMDYSAAALWDCTYDGEPIDDQSNPLDILIALEDDEL